MEAKFKVPESEIDTRIINIQIELQANEIDALFIVQRVDLYYFTGTAQNGFLYIPATGPPLLLIKKYLPRAKTESSIKDIFGIKSIKEVPEFIAGFYGKLPERLGFEFDVIPVRDFNFYQDLFTGTGCVDGSALIRKVRMIKSEWEIEQIKKSGVLSCLTFEYISENIRPGLTEMELSGMFETFARKFNHGGKLRVRNYQTEGYPWHVLSGKNGGKVGLLDSPASGEGTSPAFPCGAGSKKLAANEPIMIDLGSVINGYHFDETRMFAIGNMPAKAMDACQISIEIHNKVLENVKPGVTMDELYNISVTKADSLGYEKQYLGPPGYKVVFIGHGIGLELIEQPIIAKKRPDILYPGMVFALEPKMVFKDEFTAGIESVFFVTETGHKLLSQTPVKVFIIKE
jgi:Xaa-Pro aminopeptidase